MPILSNPRHERFAQELAKGKSATEASDVSGVRLRPAVNLVGAYVYLLADPRDGCVFYIGKGTRRRVSTHWRAMLAGHANNAAKHERLCAIRQSGHRVIELCVADGLGAEAAYHLEQGLIRAVGFTRLTNILPGVQTKVARDLAKVEDMIARIKPFTRWYRERRPSHEDCVLYRRVLHALHRSATLLRRQVAV